MKRAPGVDLKLRAARRKLKAFQRSHDNFIARDAYELRTEHYVNRADPSLMQLSLRHFKKKGVRLPTSHWSLLIDEITYHLRSALDASVCDLSTTDKRPNPTSTSFPITTERGKFDRKAIRYLSDDQGTFIESVQPYDRPNDLLAILHSINRRNKHRLMHFSDLLIGLDQQAVDRNLELNYSGLDLIQIVLRGAIRQEDGAEFIRIIFRKTAAKPTVQVNMKLEVAVFLEDWAVTQDNPTGGLITQMVNRVDQIIADLYAIP